MKTLIFWVEKNKTFSRAFRGAKKGNDQKSMEIRELEYLC